MTSGVSDLLFSAVYDDARVDSRSVTKRPRAISLVSASSSNLLSNVGLSKTPKGSTRTSQASVSESAERFSYYRAVYPRLDQTERAVSRDEEHTLTSCL